MIRKTCHLLLTLSLLGASSARGAPEPPPIPGPVPTEIALSPLPEGPAMVLLDATVAPARVELVPPGLAIASGWYRLGGRVLVAVPLKDPMGAHDRLRFVPSAPAPPGTAAVTLRDIVRPEPVPLTAPLRGPHLVLDLPRRISLRALLLRGELEGARLLFEGRILSPREEPFAGRKVVLVPPGPQSPLLAVAADPASDLSIETASLHAGYPLPAPETFRLKAGEAGEYSFEVPERWGDAVIRFDAYDVPAAEELELEFEGQRMSIASAAEGASPPGAWSEPRELILPAGQFAHGRRSILTFRLRPPAGGSGAADLGAGLRRLSLDQPLPASGPFGLGPEGNGDHGGELLLSWWPASPGAHLLRLRALGLEGSGALAVLVGGAEIGLVDRAGGSADSALEAEVRIPAELVRVGELNTVLVRPARAPWTPIPWAVRDLRVLPEPAPDLARAEGHRLPPRETGPVLSLSETTEAGQPSQSELIAIPPEPPALPGQAAKPVGEVVFVAAVPVADPVEGGVPPGRTRGLALDEEAIGPPAPMGPDPEPPDSGPAVARESPSGAAGEALPGAETLVRGPDLPGMRGPELPPLRPPELAIAALREPTGARLELSSDPPGARVFLARSPGYRGSFLGLTPVTVYEPSTGPVYFRFERPESHDAWVAAWLAGAGSLTVSRTLLPWRGIDFSRPADPRHPRARGAREGYAAPAPADLDADGRVDLVVGGDKGGLWWLRNEEPIGAPRFGPAVPLKLIDGRPLEVDGYAAPAVVDWDGDGQADLLVGAKSGEVHFFRRASASRGLAFENRGVLVADGVALSAGNDAVPMVVDWNGDAHADLLIGSGYGVVVLFEGLGGGALSQRGPVQQEGAPLQFLLDVVPIDYADWNGDGIRDLVLAGMYGNVLLYPGKGSGAAVPDFGLSRPVTIRGGLDLYVGTYPHGFALDLDGDGYRDLVFGNAAGEILWLRGGEPHEFDELLPVGLPGKLP